MTIPIHKVFISFQHGCQKSNKPCGVKYMNNPFSTIPMVDFKTCTGYCGRNKTNSFQLNDYNITKFLHIG